MTLQEQFSLQVAKNDGTASVDMAGTVPREKIQAVYAQVLGAIGKERKIDGFRDGTAPPSVVEREVGPLEVWSRSAQEVVMRHFAEIVAEENLAPIGTPKMQIISVPDKGDVSFRITFFVLPEVHLPEYADLIGTIEKPGEVPEATDEDVAEVVRDIRRDLYRKAHPEKSEPDDSNLPELTDAYVRNLSDRYENVESFLRHVRESVTREKKLHDRALFRQKILDTVLEKVSVVIPDIIIEEDSKRAYEDLKEHAGQFGTTVEEYLTSKNMDEPALWEQLKQEAKKRSQMQVIMNAVSAKERIYADQKEVEKETERLKGKGHGMSEDKVRTYIESVLTNEAVMQFLEKKIAESPVSTPRPDV